MVDFLDKHKTILDFIGKGKIILEIGCSDGSVSALLKQCGNEIIGVEVC